MNFGFMKEFPVTIPLLAFNRMLHHIKQPWISDKLA